MTERAISMCLNCHKLLLHSASASYFLFSLQVYEKVIVLLQLTEMHLSGFLTEEGDRRTFPLIPKIWKISPPPCPPHHKEIERHLPFMFPCLFANLGPHVRKKISLITFRQILPKFLPVDAHFLEHNHDLFEKARW